MDPGPNSLGVNGLDGPFAQGVQLSSNTKYGTYSQATPGLLNACNREYKQKFHCSFLSLLGLENQFSATKKIVVHLDTYWISSMR